MIIVDLVKLGDDRGFEKRRLDGARSSLRSVLVTRKLALGADAEARIDGCTDTATLQRWLCQAVLAASAAEVFQ